MIQGSDVLAIPNNSEQERTVDVSAVNELKNLIASNPSKHGQTTRQKIGMKPRLSQFVIHIS